MTLKVTITKPDPKMVAYTTAVQFAAYDGDMELVSHLQKHILQLNANLYNAPDDETALVVHHLCRGGHWDKAKNILNTQDATEYWWNFGFEGACVGGQYDIIEEMITRGVDCKYGIQGACSAGDLSLVERLWDKEYVEQLNMPYLVCSATRNKHNNVAEFLLSNGASLNDALKGAIIAEDLNSIKYYIAKGAILDRSMIQKTMKLYPHIRR